MLKCSIEECIRKSNLEGCRECTPTEEEKKQAADAMLKMIEVPLAGALSLWFTRKKGGKN